MSKTYVMLRGYESDLRYTADDAVEMEFYVPRETQDGVVEFKIKGPKGEGEEYFTPKYTIAAFSNVRSVYIEGAALQVKDYDRNHDLQVAAAQPREATWKDVE
jgi:hypothetical protein